MTGRHGENTYTRNAPDSMNNNATDKYNKQIQFDEASKARMSEMESSDNASVLRTKSAGKAKKKIYIGAISAVLSIALACCVGVSVYKGIFRITTFGITGDVSAYSADELMSAAGISYGDGLYSFDKSSAERAIIKKYPEISSVKFEVQAPSTVNISLSVADEVFYADIYGELWTLDADFRLINVTNEKEAAERKLIKLIIPEVTSAVAGNVIEFSDRKVLRHVKNFSSALLSSGIAERMSAADLSNIYNIKIVCDGLYLVSLGEADDLEEKLIFTEAVLADSMFASGNKATVDVSNVSEASVIINNQLDLNW